MADEKKKARYITTSQHAMVGHTGAPTEILAPGERVPFDEEADSHKFLLAQIESGNPAYSHLSVVEVSHEDEEKQKKELEEKLEEAEKIAAEQRQEEARKAGEESGPAEPLEGQPAVNEGTAYPPKDVEAQKLAEQSGAGQRASTQADVVEDDDEGGSRKRAARGSRKG
jgi:hypothetical protein